VGPDSGTPARALPARVSAATDWERRRVEVRHASIVAVLVGLGVLAYTMYQMSRILDWFE
jgi:hypothetical protein